MQILNQQVQPIVTVVGCLHGNEYLGLRAFEYFKGHQTEYSAAQFILANEPAIAADKRFVDCDLNRSFPGDIEGNLEQQLAAELLLHILSSRFVLDLHTTTSNIVMTPIVTNLNGDTRRVLGFCRSQEVALIESPLANASLISQCRAGVSLEYNHRYAETTQAVDDVFRILEYLLNDQQTEPSERQVFHIDQATSASAALPDDAKNFVFCPALSGYPFLIGERAYPNGLLAGRQTNLKL